MNIPNDPNAVLAFDQTCKYVAAREYGLLWEKMPEKARPYTDERSKANIRREVKESRLRHFMEQGEAKKHEQDGTFVCESGYAFKNIVEESENYRIYRCDGGHHFAVVYIEHKEREGSMENSRRIEFRNGEYVMVEGPERNNDDMELD